MRHLRWLPALAVLVVVASPGRSAGVDLSKIDRSIAKEPAYQSKSPKYCLLVFGPEAATRVWLVLDGGTLYVDRNGNGDLTEADKKVTAARPEEATRDLSQRNRNAEFSSIPITATPGVPKGTNIEVRNYGDTVYIICQAEGRPWQRAGRDIGGQLQFGDKPQTAPIIHFNGAMVVMPDELYTLARTGDPTEFYTMIGTPGLGKGTFACIGYQDVPKDVHPVAEFEFPAKTAGAEPVRVKMTLDHRC